METFSKNDKRSVPIVGIDNGKNVDNGYEDRDHGIYLDTPCYRKMNRRKKSQGLIAVNHRRMVWW